MTIQAIVLDFDGVILESVDIKTRAFRELFKGYPEQMEGIVQFHLHNAGISRFEKFRTIYRDYLRLPLDDQEVDRLGQAFSLLVFQEILRCPFVPGAWQFLEKYSGRYELFLASATPTDELREIVTRRGFGAFFKGVCGYPPGKATILREIMDQHGWQPGEVVFVGDALGDYLTAREVGATFVGRVGRGQSNPFGDNAPVVEDLAQMDRLWPLLLKQLSPGSGARKD